MTQNNGTDSNRIIGEVIQNYRRKLSMTQEEFGDALGVTKQAISQWEHGINRPGLEFLLRLVVQYKDWRRAMALEILDAAAYFGIFTPPENGEPPAGTA